MPQERTNHDVFDDRHILERDGHLERPCHAQPRVRFGTGLGDILIEEPDHARSRFRVPSQTVEERAFARAVRTDQTNNFALAHLQVRAVHRTECPELLDDATRFKEHEAPPVQKTSYPRKSYR
jgi:hypothetical protein